MNTRISRAALFVASFLPACWASAPANGPECSDAQDIRCPAGKVCLDYVCHAVCRKSSDCGPAEACLDQACQPYSMECTEHADCAEGFYCLGSACAKRLPLGGPCGTVDVACASGLCVEGVCCDSRCDGLCQTCIVGPDAGDGDDGLCGNVPDGDDPGDAHCPGGPACDGAGACYAKQQGDACGAGYECLTGACSDGVCCNGQCDGVCETCATGSCEAIPDLTDPDEECAGEATCDGARACWAGQLGDTCSAPNECESGFCVDGVCCSSECDGVCQTCSSGASPGTCSEVTNTSDVGTCDFTTAAGTCATAPCQCGPSGECKQIEGSGCQSNHECASGSCRGGICCDTSCTGTCVSCNADHTGAVSGECRDAIEGLDPSDECGDAACDGSGACFDLGQGDECSFNYQCLTGFCVDGFCCNDACDGTCEGCDGVDMPSPPGTCGAVYNWKDPAEECDGPTACNGAGGCWAKVGGDPCNADGECLSGSCCGGACTHGWQPISTPTTEYLYGIWGSAWDDVFAVGDAGTIIHFDGTNWSLMSTPGTPSLRAISGANNKMVIAVGDGGVALHYDGVSWTKVDTGTSASLLRVTVAPPAEAYAVGSPVIHWSGETWTDVSSDFPSGLYRAASSGPGGWCVGGGGTCLWGPERDEVIFCQTPSWERQTTPSDGCLRDLAFSGETLLAAVVVPDRRTNWSSWSVYSRAAAGGPWTDLGAPGPVFDLWVGPTKTFAASDRKILVYDGSSWSVEPTPTIASDIWGASDCQVFAVSGNQVLRRY